MNFLVELRRRNVIRMAGLYLVGAWLVVQVAATLVPVFEAPAWVMKALVALLAIGFVAALVFAWVFELTPEGLKRDSDVAAAESIAPQTARRMDRMLLVVMALALGYFAVDKFVLAPARQVGGDPVATAPAKATPSGQVAKDAATLADPKSLAVLAFADLSAARDNGYFADGVAEEILNALAKVRELKVAGRTSSFWYKGRNEPLAAIGAALGVAHVLDGSVRKQGQRLRISAQLIRVSDGFPLWSESFNGSDADIFALQENIARRVTEALKVALNAGQQDRLVEVGTADPEAYALYLRATDVFNRRESLGYDVAIAAARKALEKDPGFARAHSRLATLFYVASGARDPAEFDQLMANAASHAQSALRLDPALAEPHAVLGSIAQGKRLHRDARRELDAALAIDPNDPSSRLWSALTWCNTGYIARCEAGLDRLLAIDPLLPNALGWRSRLLISSGELDAAERMATRAQELGLRWVASHQALLAHARGDLAAASRYTEQSVAIFAAGLPADAPAAFANSRWGMDKDAVAQTHEIIDEVLAGKPARVNPLLSLTLVRMGEIERGLDLFARVPTSNDPQFLGELLGTRLYPAVWKSPAFPHFLRETGIAALWDELGPPENCRKDASGDYHCE